MDTKRNYFELASVGDSSEFDFLRSAIPIFRAYITRPSRLIRFGQEYVGRLDLLANEVYQTPHLWWALALANRIDDPFDDAFVDTMIVAPDILDIYEFYDDNYVNTASEEE